MPDVTPGHLGRNEPCHCGSGKKYKRCCLVSDEAAEREEQAKAAAEAEADASSPEEGSEKAQETPGPSGAPKPKRHSNQPWTRSAGKNVPYAKSQKPRKPDGG